MAHIGVSDAGVSNVCVREEERERERESRERETHTHTHIYMRGRDVYIKAQWKARRETCLLCNSMCRRGLRQGVGCTCKPD